MIHALGRGSAWHIAISRPFTDQGHSSKGQGHNQLLIKLPILGLRMCQLKYYNTGDPHHWQCSTPKLPVVGKIIMHVVSLNNSEHSVLFDNTCIPTKLIHF